jgi:hypothetical protein
VNTDSIVQIVDTALKFVGDSRLEFLQFTDEKTSYSLREGKSIELAGVFKFGGKPDQGKQVVAVFGEATGNLVLTDIKIADAKFTINSDATGTSGASNSIILLFRILSWAASTICVAALIVIIATGMLRQHLIWLFLVCICICPVTLLAWSGDWNFNPFALATFGGGIKALLLEVGLTFGFGPAQTSSGGEKITFALPLGAIFYLVYVANWQGIRQLRT